ncbi:MAG: M14 family metallopeptidase [Bacilli bacterium]|nr:M14 family metallopeptidase [Bacilli bacterium]
MKKFKLSKTSLTGKVVFCVSLSVVLAATSFLGIAKPTNAKAYINQSSNINSSLDDNYITLDDKLEDIISNVSGEASTALSSLNNEYKDYGKFIVPGMSKELYESAINKEWEKIEVINNEQPSLLTYNIKDQHKYSDIENYLFNLSKYDYIDLYKIGESDVKKLPIYNLVIDLVPNPNKKTIMLAAGTHAREGTTDILMKMINDLINSASNDEYIQKLLKNVRIVVLPCVNPDGREMIIDGELGSNWKANGDGTDINRNFPAIDAGQVVKGIRKSGAIAKKPGNDFYPGPYYGSASETRAAMGWLYKYITNNEFNSELLIEFHAQGRGNYGGKPYDIKYREAIAKSLTKNISSSLNEGAGHGYRWVYEGKKWGLNGVGATFTDFANSLAMGAEFDEKTGRLCYRINGELQPLMVFKDLDNIKEFYNPTNENFKTTTIEYGSGSVYLGYKTKNRNARAKEYDRANFGSLIVKSMELILGNSLLNDLETKTLPVTTRSYNNIKNNNNTINELLYYKKQLIYLNNNSKKLIKRK